MRETCELAISRIQEQKNRVNGEEIGPRGPKSPFLSVDPATPSSLYSSVEQLRYLTSIFLDYYATNVTNGESNIQGNSSE